MKYSNPIHRSIHEKIVMPSIKQIRQSVEANIVLVNYRQNTVNVMWKDAESGMIRQSKEVQLPIDGNGVFRQGVKIGDKVTLAFRHGNPANPYITVVHKSKSNSSSINSIYGSAIPKGIGYL